MLSFKCTKKVQIYLGISTDELVSAPEVKTTLLGAWYVNQITIDRRKVFLFMNEKTLLSFVCLGVKKSKSLKLDFPSTFLYHFFTLAKLFEFPLEHTEQFVEDYYQSEYRKTDSKRLLGNMNDLAHLYRHYIMYDGGFNYCDLSQIIFKVNQTPQRSLNWNYSSDVVHDILAQPNKFM
jgi:hypothetical protein